MTALWWRTYVRKLPELDFLEQAGSFADVDAFIPFIMEELDLPPEGCALDLGCGRGGFSVRLAQWGYRITAVEESPAALEIGREAARRRGVEIEWRHASLGSLPERSAFDGALMLDFGGFADPDNAQILRTIAAALRPGAKLVFGTCNPYYWARGPQVAHATMGGVDLISRYAFDFQAGTVVSRVRAVLPAGERRDLPAVRHRAYTPTELRALTDATGLADLRIYGQDEGGRPRPDRPLDSLSTPFFHCVALRPQTGESGEGI